MVDLNNIKNYIARAIVFKDEFEKMDELQDKFAKFTLLFPTLEDKMVCKAIFDIKFTSEVKARKFISQMVNGVNSMVPQKLTEMIDIYNQASVLVEKNIQKQNKNVSDSGGERFSEEEKQGAAIEDEKHGRASDQFIVMNSTDENYREKLDDENIIKKKGKKIVSTLSRRELDTAKKENDGLQQLKKNMQAEQIKKKEEEQKRAAYEKSLAERRMKKEYSKMASELQRIYDTHDD